MDVIAFIPVRGGSKSIPLKNIRDFCGKPLVCWNIEALENCPEVTQIVVATDSDKIWNVVHAEKYDKVTLFRRSEENAKDTASTESVMLEYIKQSSLEDEAVFMLVQATSPLTQSKHFSEALHLYESGIFDSILTCVRMPRFFWDDNGNSVNYDYRSRPRRQDFKGTLMENGAFYINTVGNVLKYENRIGGKIGIYEMPEYTAVEIDEPDDWYVLENLMRKHILTKEYKNRIKLFLTDVDGTLTDGGMYYSENGDELKKFNTRDGTGLSYLHDIGIKTGIITGETRELNRKRAEKLNIDFIQQGCSKESKLAVAKKLAEDLNISLNEVAYIGDDVNCYELLSNVGIAACPADACDKVKHIPGIHIMTRKGGSACVREFIENYIL